MGGIAAPNSAASELGAEKREARCTRRARFDDGNHVPCARIAGGTTNGVGAATPLGYIPSGLLGSSLGRSDSSIHLRSASSSVTLGNLIFWLMPGPIRTV